MSAKVYEFRTRQQRQESGVISPAQAPQESNEPTPVAVGSPVRTVGRAVLGGLRYMAFLLLYWLRAPLKFLLGLAAVPALIALPMIAFGMESSPMKTTMLLWVFGAGFGSFVLSWFYDSLLLWLSPEPIILN